MEKKLYRVRVVMEAVVEHDSAKGAADYMEGHVEMLAGMLPPENIMVTTMGQINDTEEADAMHVMGWDKGSIPLNSSDMCIEEWLNNRGD